MNERRIGAALLTMFIGGIAGGFGGANLSLTESGSGGNARGAKSRKELRKSDDVKADEKRRQSRLAS